MISYTGRTGKTISGQVIADEGYKKTEFNTPNGNLIVYTTADQEQLQTGKTLTGTVIAEPSGKTQKEKDDNLQELRKAVLMVGETTVAITGLEQAIQYTGKKNAENQFNVSLSDPSGTNRQTLGWTIPKEPVKTYSDPAQPLPTMFINENLVLGNDVITVHTIPRTDAEFRESDQFTLADEKGRSFPVHPLAQSPSTTVIRIPAEAAKGNIRIIRSRDGQATDRVNFNYADLELSSPNTNLKSGERSFVMTNVVVHGEEKPGHPLPRFRVTLTNLNPEIVSMEGGDVQYVSFPGNDNTWMAKRMIEGKVVGRFSVNATLVSDLNNTNDPFRAQKEVLNDPESFNRWIAALKSDLRNYALAQANDPRGQNIRANAIRAMENLPDCNSLASLNECKMMADELLQPLQVPKGAATCWQCSYEAMKAATGQLQEKISGKATVVNWPLIQCGLEIMRKTGDELNDDQLEDSAEAITDQLPDSLSLNFSLSFEDKVFEFLMIIIRHMDSAIKQQQKKMNDLQKDSSHVFKYSPHELLLATELMNRSGNDNMVTPYMVGYLDPFRKILWTTPREKQRILGELGAQKLPNGKYKISALNFNGKTISYPVDVMMDNPEKILLLADEKDEGIPLDIDKTRKEDAKGKKEEGKPIDIDEKKPGSTDPLTDTKKKEDEGIPFDVKKKEDDEGIPLDIIFTPKYGGEFKDSTGTVYRFWRRSKCTLVDKGSKERSPCEPDGYSVFDLKTNKYKIIPDGHYCQFENYDWYRCKGGKETDVCTERLIVTSLKYIYANKNCTTLIDVVPEMDWACQ